MDYKVFVAEDAEEDLDNFIRYLLLEKKNEQAARNLLEDFEITKENLTRVAGSLKDCTNPRLKNMDISGLILWPIGILCFIG